MISRYESIEELSGSELFRIERGRRTDTALQLLVITPRHDPPRAVEIDAMWREQAVLTELSIAGVPRMLALVPQPNDVLLLEDPGGVQVSALMAAARADIHFGLSIGIQLALILSEIHRRGIIHNGIRPDAIIWDAKNMRSSMIHFADASGGVAGIAPPIGHALPTERLVYVSPEQTGRMNRSIDHRSDLYSLGVVLYELLTGRPPFRSNQAIELIHSHIARIPAAPADLDVTIPGPVSLIVMKLLAKAAEDRYQSALGLQRDLEYCAQELVSNGNIAVFPLGRYDVGDQFIVS